MARTVSARALLAGALSLVLAAPVLAGAGALQSGRYDSLLLAVTPDHQVEGYYFEALGGEPTRECAFYLKGAVADAGATPVSTWLDDVYPGSVASSARGVTLTVEKGQQHPGCMSVLMPQIADGLELSRIASKPWIGLLAVSADKAYLLKNPDGATAKRPYIVKDDVVGVLAYKGDWAQVEFIDKKGRSFIGWIRAGQYARLAAPQG